MGHLSFLEVRKLLKEWETFNACESMRVAAGGRGCQRRRIKTSLSKGFPVRRARRRAQAS